MSKIMSILEQYNLVQKVKEKPKEGIGILESDIKDESNPKEKIISTKEKPVQKEKTTPESLKEKVIESEIDYNKNIMINEIYTVFGFANGSINNVFMLQNLINALPENLPQDVKKQSIMNIISASNIDLKELVNDGEKRLDSLNKVINDYSNETNKRIHEYKDEIEKLQRLINNYQEQIKLKENILEEQLHLVKYETQKIENIIEFFHK